MSAPPFIIRAAQEGETIRARQLFSEAAEPPPLAANFILALRLQPIERIVATLAWWREDAMVRFLIARKPRILPEEAAAALVPAFEAMPGFGAENIKYGCLLAENQDVAPWLARHGYQPLHTERLFEAPYFKVHERVGAFLARHAVEMPQSWATEPIRLHSPEIVWPLIAAYRLTNLESLRRMWSIPGPQGYDPEISNILFEAGQPLGAMLVRTDPVCLTVDVRVVKPISSRLRSLANLALFGYGQRITTPNTWRVMRFRGDQAEHRETSNLARRMGGEQVGFRHIYSRPGGPPNACVQPV